MILETLTVASLTGITQELAKRAHQLVARSSGSITKNWSLQKSAKNWEKSVLSVREIKTLWQTDKRVDISEFFVAPHVEWRGSRFSVNSLNDIPSSGHMLLEGIAGQGKSILLRHLCAVEMQTGFSLPVFIELRHATHERGIAELVAEWFAASGITLTPSDARKAIVSQKMSLFLDAFDEVPPPVRSSIQKEIDDLCKECERSRILVTSRPESGIVSSPRLDVASVSDLTKKECRDVIYRLSQFEDVTELLVNRLNDNRNGIGDLLVTPLLVTLLVITYKSYSDLPDTLSEFYDALFKVLLKRHDGTKPGYRRSLKCSLNDTQYRLVFDAMCFESKQSASQSFRYDHMYDYASSALEFKGHSDDPEAYLDDIVGGTSLLVRDGQEYRFIHKSVQEYYSASFLATLPENVLMDVLQGIIIDERVDYWRQELLFLETINQYRHAKYFEIPMLNDVLQTVDGFSNQSRSVMKYLLGSSELLLRTEGKPHKGKIRVTQIKLIYSGPLPLGYRPSLSTEQSKILTRKVDWRSELLKKNREHVDVKYMLDNKTIKDLMSVLLPELIQSMRRRLEGLKLYVENSEKGTSKYRRSLKSLPSASRKTNK